MVSFSAVLLAGGKSRRMGRDKALVTLPATGEPLWIHQLRTLQVLAPAEIFWSGTPRVALPAEVRVIEDSAADAGPLGGISAGLDVLKSDLLLVMAIDLPAMDADFLRNLLSRCNAGRGIVPQRGDFFEPLAAIYPRTLRALARDHLRQRRHTLQEFVREALQRDEVSAWPVSPMDGRFVNLNSPDDLEAQSR